MIVFFLILIAYIVLEFILFAKGKSIGKAIIGLQVVSSTDGKPFRFWKMLFRECFVKSASGSVFGLGYIWILIDEKNRGWHDKILDSYVVDLKESEKMNFRRHLEKARAEAQKSESFPMPIAEPEPSEDVKAEEPAVPDAEPAEEPVVEVIPEVVVNEAETSIEETSETEVNTSDEEAVNPADETAEEVRTEKPEPSMAMKKEELLEAARERGVQISSRATKAAIIEAIEKADNETEK